MSETANILEIITHIQYNAYLLNGVPPISVKEHYKRHAENMVAFQKSNPNYLIDRDIMLEEDPSLDYISLDLVERAERSVNLPYQDPFLHAWLSDSWEYHCSRLYDTRDIAGKQVTLATAPTGEFNAIAVSAFDGCGIVIEEGLVRFANTICKALSSFLYKRLSDRDFQRTTVDEIQELCKNNKSQVEFIAETILDFVVNGSIPDLQVSERGPKEFDVAYTMFAGFVSFIFEHEVYHLVEQNAQKKLQDFAIHEKEFDKLWDILVQQVFPHVPETFSKDEIRFQFYKHQEECLADIRGMNRLNMLGQIDNCVWPTIDGGIIFFNLIYCFRETYNMIVEPELYQVEQKMGGRHLSISGILTGASHPYPIVRWSGVLVHAQSETPDYFKLMASEYERIASVFKAVRAEIASIVNAQAELDVHPKWKRSFSSLV